MPQFYDRFVTEDNTYLVTHYPHHAVCNGRVFPYYESQEELAYLCLNATGAEWGRLEREDGTWLADAYKEVW